MRRNRLRNKQKNSKNFFAGGLLKRTLEQTLPVVIPLIFFGVFFFFLFQAALHFLNNSSYFAVETVEASSAFKAFSFRDANLMGSLLGKNIFSVDLPALEEELSRKHPELLTSFVTREFPNRIRMNVTPRLPVAEVENPEGLLVDREGVILPATHRVQRDVLPLIAGLPEHMDRSSIGRRFRSKAMEEALRFIAILEKLPELKRHVRAIDVRDAKNLFFLTPDGLEVRVGYGDYEEKLKLFDRTRVTLGDRLHEVKYIDLRFDDVVVGSR
ncbi:MAG: cell division protein FtsQ/DivIB [Candidatus Omnitrophota bacterium]